MTKKKDIKPFDEQPTTLAMAKDAKGKKKPVVPTVKDLDNAAKKTYMYPSWSHKSPYS